MIIIGYIVPLKTRPQYMAVQSCTYGVASVAGPLLGGLFTDSKVLTWRFCFWISLPFGAVTAIIMVAFLHNPKQTDWKLSFKEKLARMDILGALFLISAMVCLLLALQWGGNEYAWSDSRVFGSLIGFGLLLAVFVSLQARHADNVTIPFRIITQRTVAASCGFTTTLAMVSSTFSYFLPIFFQAVKGETASGSGVKILPFLMSLTGITLFSGAAITAVGYYVPFMWTGGALALIGSSLLYTLDPSSSTGKLVGYQIITGLGIGVSVQIPFIAAQVVLSGKDMASGMSIIGFFNALGGALAISIAQNIFSNALKSELQNIQGIDAEALLRAGATDIARKIPDALLAPALSAFSYAITRAYILGIAAAATALVCSFLMQFRSVKEQNAGVITDNSNITDENTVGKERV
ncbi:major facilitator superfamily transporter [Phlyctema vagabunda]|uniref:Major facilitator superfamily transporter n=1 Tax=Phlyctema vagabunda TaxID=108571 RepID=A0ABR4PE68_9HELO